MLYSREKKEAIIEDKRLCGYFVIVTSERMSAREALELYKSRDASEKLFMGDKAYLGNKSLRVASDQTAATLRELEKIEMVRMTDGKYHVDHAITATQKAILNVFGIDGRYIKKAATQLTDILCKAE